ncbi:MAG TPA: hypothetical protein PLM16_02275 [Candidatus Woesebacteria bacterium]|nr:hypothetical protein [Candidatus Woesebacteria bacterium]
MKKESILAIGFLVIVLAVLIYFKSRPTTLNRDTFNADNQQSERVSNPTVKEEEIVSNGQDSTLGQDASIISSPSTSSTTLASTKIEDRTYILFYGETCPHCHVVLEWIDSSQVEGKLTIIKKEVYSDTKNNEQMKLAVKSCNLTSSGVPFLFTADKKCVVGSTPIIDYLTQEAGL